MQGNCTQTQIDFHAWSKLAHDSETAYKEMQMQSKRMFEEKPPYGIPARQFAKAAFANATTSSDLGGMCPVNTWKPRNYALYYFVIGLKFGLLFHHVTLFLFVSLFLSFYCGYLTFCPLPNLSCQFSEMNIWKHWHFYFFLFHAWVMFCTEKYELQELVFTLIRSS